jgi:hypothetical protein
MRERAEAALLLTSTSATHCNPVCRTRIFAAAGHHVVGIARNTGR